MHLVDEQDDVARIHNLFDAFFQALLELAAILGARNERTHIKCEQTFASQDVRHLVRYDELRQALDDGGLAHARLADKQRIVLLAAGEHLHDPLDLACTADDRVELAVARLLCEIGAELLEHAVRRPSVRVERVAAGVHRALPHQVVERRAHIVARDAQAREHLERRSVALAHDAQQQMLGGYVGLAHLHGLAQAVLQHALDARGERQVAGHVGVLVDGDHLADGLHHGVVLHALAVERLGGQTVFLLDKTEQNVLGAHIGLMKRSCLILSKDKHFTRFVREFLE